MTKTAGSLYVNKYNYVLTQAHTYAHTWPTFHSGDLKAIGIHKASKTIGIHKWSPTLNLYVKLLIVCQPLSFM